MADNQDKTTEYVQRTTLWYDRAATRNMNIFIVLKVAQISIAAGIPVVSLVTSLRDIQPIIAGVAGALLVVIEGVQQTCQFQQRWIQFRSACEALRREQSLFQALAGPYRSIADPEASLAERVNEIVASENNSWKLLYSQPSKNSGQ